MLDYLSRDKISKQRMRDILFPPLLQTRVLIRDQMKKAFVDVNPHYDESKVGFYLTLVSSQLGMKRNDFLRQVGAHEYLCHHWEKDNFDIRSEYRDSVKEVLDKLKKK